MCKGYKLRLLIDRWTRELLKPMPYRASKVCVFGRGSRGHAPRLNTIFNQTIHYWPSETLFQEPFCQDPALSFSICNWSLYFKFAATILSFIFLLCLLQNDQPIVTFSISRFSFQVDTYKSPSPEYLTISLTESSEMFLHSLLSGVLIMVFLLN